MVGTRKKRYSHSASDATALQSASADDSIVERATDSPPRTRSTPDDDGDDGDDDGDFFFDAITHSAQRQLEDIVSFIASGFTHETGDNVTKMHDGVAIGEDLNAEAQPPDQTHVQRPTVGRECLVLP